jgi:predicted transcriptional regulator
MEEGYILSNKYRRAIFDELASGETNIDRIAKKHHIVRPVARKVAEDFMNGGILEKKGNKFIFTKEGKKLMTTIRG